MRVRKVSITWVGEIEDIQQRYIEHTKAAIDSLNG